MKAVMISIQPEWCELIANRKKTIEVRKTRPKIETPFKCFIYMTYGKTPKIVSLPSTVGFVKMSIHDAYPQTANGKVVGEFVCDKIYDITTPAGILAEYLFFAHHGKNIYDSQDLIAYELLEKTCLSMQNIIDYSQGKILYGWHISDFKIYNKPKDLSEFKKAGFLTEEDWLYALYPNTHCHYDAWVKKFELTKPPQSWCYIESLED